MVYIFVPTNHQLQAYSGLKYVVDNVVLKVESVKIPELFVLHAQESLDYALMDVS